MKDKRIGVDRFGRIFFLDRWHMPGEFNERFPKYAQFKNLVIAGLDTPMKIEQHLYNAARERKARRYGKMPALKLSANAPSFENDAVVIS